MSREYAQDENYTAYIIHDTSFVKVYSFIFEDTSSFNSHPVTVKRHCVKKKNNAVYIDVIRVVGKYWCKHIFGNPASSEEIRDSIILKDKDNKIFSETNINYICKNDDRKNVNPKNGKSWHIKLSFITQETITEFISNHLSFALKSVRQHSCDIRFSFEEEIHSDHTIYHIFFTLQKKELIPSITRIIQRRLMSHYSIAFISNIHLSVNPNFKILPKNIYEDISVDIFKICTVNVNMTVGNLTSYFFYFYTLSCICFFNTKKDACLFNEIFFKKIISKVIAKNEILRVSEFEFEKVKEKTILEYESMCIQYGSIFKRNYEKLINKVAHTCWRQPIWNDLTSFERISVENAVPKLRHKIHSRIFRQSIPFVRRKKLLSTICPIRD
jgi:hypothetical protein